jgi:hypothetical protein
MKTRFSRSAFVFSLYRSMSVLFRRAAFAAEEAGGVVGGGAGGWAGGASESDGGAGVDAGVDVADLARRYAVDEATVRGLLRWGPCTS